MGRLIQRSWLTGPDLYGDETCTECGALYRGKRAKRIHKDWHAQLDEDINGIPEPEDPGGYVLPDGINVTYGDVVEAFPSPKESTG